MLCRNEGKCRMYLMQQQLLSSSGTSLYSQVCYMERQVILDAVDSY